MKKAICHVRSIGPFSQSRYYANEVPKNKKESHEDYEKRTWRNRLHTDDDGNVLIPLNMFKNCLKEGAKYLSQQIPGKGKQTYTKHFEAGIMLNELNVTLPIKADDVFGEWMHCSADGKPGGATRVMKCFPRIDQWEAKFEMIVIDDTITEEVFKNTLQQAGIFIGVGRGRPRKGHDYGRFAPVSITFEEIDEFPT